MRRSVTRWMRAFNCQSRDGRISIVTMARPDAELPWDDPFVEGALDDGCVVILPTETVAGFGVRASDARAIAKLIAIKGRTPDKPFAVCVRGLEQAETLGLFDDTARQLARDNWPGPLTLIVPARRNKGLRMECLGSHEGRQTVALRCPDVFWREAFCATPLALTSANRTGEPAFNDTRAAWEAFPDLVHVPQCDPGSGSPSTIVRVMGGDVEYLRMGAAPLKGTP